LWYEPSKVRFRFWHKIFYRPVLRYWAQLQIQMLDWVEIYQKIPKVFVYIGINFQVNRSSEGTCDIDQNKLYEFCYLLPFDVCILLIWQGSFFWNDVTACFENFLVPQESLISWNIIFKSGNDSLMFQNPFLIRIPYSSWLHKKRRVCAI
jgi:hypothetical protein